MTLARLENGLSETISLDKCDIGTPFHLIMSGVFERTWKLMKEDDHSPPGCNKCGVKVTNNELSPKGFCHDCRKEGYGAF